MNGQMKTLSLPCSCPHRRVGPWVVSRRTNNAWTCPAFCTEIVSQPWNLDY